jgi:hypothetical protein
MTKHARSRARREMLFGHNPEPFMVFLERSAVAHIVRAPMTAMLLIIIALVCLIITDSGSI